MTLSLLSSLFSPFLPSSFFPRPPQKEQQQQQGLPLSWIQVTCVGDSITSGKCCQGGYPTMLQAKLGSSGYKVLNAGFSGHTMLKKGYCGPVSACVDKPLPLCLYLEQYITYHNDPLFFNKIEAGINNSRRLQLLEHRASPQCFS